VLIRDTLWSELPDSYDDNAIGAYRQRIYEFFYSTYPAAVWERSKQSSLSLPAAKT